MVSFFQILLLKFCTHFFVSHARYMIYLSHPPWFDHYLRILRYIRTLRGRIVFLMLKLVVHIATTVLERLNFIAHKCQVVHVMSTPQAVTAADGGSKTSYFEVDLFLAVRNTVAHIYSNYVPENQRSIFLLHTQIELPWHNLINT
jgi:hypothetical protein